MRFGTAMRALCARRHLLAALESLEGRLKEGPIHVAVEAEGSTVVLVASANRRRATARVHAAVLHSGLARAPMSPFLELVRGIDAGEIGLGSSQGSERRLELRANGRTYLLPQEPALPPDAAETTDEAAPLKADNVLGAAASPAPEFPGSEESSSAAHPALPEFPGPWRPEPESEPAAESPVEEEGAVARLRAAVRRPERRELVVPGATGLSLLLLVVGLLPLPHAVRALSLVAAAAVASLIPLLDARYRGRGGSLEVGVLVGLACLVLFPLRALVVLLDLDPLENVRVDLAPFADVRRTLVVATLGILAGSLAYVAPLGSRLGGGLTLPRVRVAETPGVRLPLALFVVGLTAQATVLAGQRVSSVASFLAGRTSGLISGATVLLMLGLALLARRAASTRDPRAARLLLGAVALTLVASLFGQFKEVAVLAVGAPTVTWLLTTPTRIRGRWLGAAGATLLVMFALVSMARHASARIDSSNPARVATALPEQAVSYSWTSGGPRSLRPWTPVTETLSLVSHRLYGYDSLALAVTYTPAVVPHQNGDTLANLAAGLVPRIVWESKPAIGIGYWFAETYWGTPPGVDEVPQSVTHLGELWIDFGWLGVILGAAILGVWYRFVYTALNPRSSGTGAIVYTIVLLTILPVDRDLPLVYVTLVQRLVFVGLVLGAAAVLSRLAARA